MYNLLLQKITQQDLKCRKTNQPTNQSISAQSTSDKDLDRFFFFFLLILSIFLKLYHCRESWETYTWESRVKREEGWKGEGERDREIEERRAKERVSERDRKGEIQETGGEDERERVRESPKSEWKKRDRARDLSARSRLAELNAAGWSERHIYFRPSI